MVYEQSEELRKRFNFLFEAVSNKLRSNLTEQRKSMNLTELKKYGEDYKEIRKYNFNRLSKIAINMATISLVDSNTYDDVAKNIENEFSDAFFKYVSYRMSPFVESMENIAEDAVNSMESSNQFQSCQNEEDICQDQLIKAYNFVFQPFEINKFPFETLGFGTYMAYFSYLLLSSPDTQQLFGRKNMRDEEEWIRSYQSEVLGNLTGKNVGKMSLLEMIQILNHNQYKNHDILQSLKKEMDCTDLDDEAGIFNDEKMPCLK